MHSHEIVLCEAEENRIVRTDVSSQNAILEKPVLDLNMRLRASGLKDAGPLVLRLKRVERISIPCCVEFDIEQGAIEWHVSRNRMWQALLVHIDIYISIYDRYFIDIYIYM